MFKFIALVAVVACVAGSSIDAAEVLSFDVMTQFSPICLKLTHYKEQEVIKNLKEVPEDIMEIVMQSAEAVDSTEDWYVDQIKALINSTKQQLGQNETLELLAKGCDAVSKFEAPLRDLYEAEKAELVAKRPELARVTFENAPCTETRRVLKAKEICQTAKSSQKPLDEAFLSVLN